MSQERAEYTTDEPETETVTPDEQEIPEATFDDILDAYEQEEEEFEFTLGDGKKKRKYRGKTINNLSDHLKLGEEARKFQAQYEKIRKAPMKDVPAPFRAWKEFARRPMEIKAAIMIVAINRLLLSPRLSQLQCLRMHDTCKMALMEIGEKLIERETEDAYNGEVDAVTDAKNE